MKRFKVFLFLALGVLISVPSISQESEENKEKKEILVFHKTEGFWHKSIPTGYDVIEDLGEDYDFRVEVTKDADEFNEEDLQQYALVVFLSTTGDILNDEQQEAFRKYIEEGGSFFGIHAAADTEYDWPWYGELVGGYFAGHPEIQQARLINNMPDHPTVSHWPESWTRTDEWYNYKELNPENKVLLYLDESSYEGGKNGDEHPIAWYKDLPGGGVSIYTGGGHTIESYREPGFREHLLRCILFALGEEIPDEIIDN